MAAANSVTQHGFVLVTNMWADTDLIDRYTVITKIISGCKQ